MYVTQEVGAGYNISHPGGCCSLRKKSERVEGGGGQGVVVILEKKAREMYKALQVWYETNTKKKTDKRLLKGSDTLKQHAKLL